MTIYATKHHGLSAALIYFLGSNSHLRTYLGAKGAFFEFADEGECKSIAHQFFSKHGGLSISDARALLDCLIQIRKTLATAIANGGEWRNDKCQQLA